MDVTWHGHSTWTVEQDDTTLLIDPFFDNPKTNLDPSTVETPDYLVLTHGHADHIADVGAFSDATVVATPELAGFVEDEFGASDTVGMNIGGTFEAGDVFLTMHRADHTNGTNTTYEYDVGMPVGVLVSTEQPGRDGSGTSFYHAGDTGLLSEMKDVIGPFLQPTAVAVPIGDHFTMGPWQAAIAVDWMDSDHAFPMHYDSFPPIEQDPEDFVLEVADTDSGASVHVLDGDERFEI